MIKGALTLPRKDEFWFDTAVALMKGKEKEILAEKGDRIKTIRCAKCGVERPESKYDCKCGYSSGGD